MKTKLIATIILALSLVPGALGQPPAPTPAAEYSQQESARTPQPTPAAAPKEPEYVQEKGFKAKIFELKNRDPYELTNVLRPLGSGFRGAIISYSRNPDTISVRDFPENIAVIEEAIKRLDVPQPARPPRPDIEFHIHVIIASNTATVTDELPSELTDVVKQLQGTLKYKSYGVMASSVHRATESGLGVSNNGVAESKLFNVSTPGGNPIFFQYTLGPLSVKDVVGSVSVEIGKFSFSMRIPLNLGGPTTQIQYDNVGFNTPVTVRDSEKVVVGTTTMGDKGLIVVVSAKVLKR